MRPTKFLALTLFTLQLCLPQGLSARILNIPDDYETIQRGINASENGDTLLVQPGVYVENLVISNRNLVLASLYLTTEDEADIDSTVIDGDQRGSVIYLENGYNRTVAVIGFTLRNGAAYSGGGVYLESYNVVIDHCDFRNNEAGNYGGAICNYWEGSLKLSYCTFDSNEAGGWGGAVFSRLLMSADHCVFSNNSAYYYGGAVHLRQWPGGTFTNCVFVNNSALIGGAIDLLWAAAAVLDRCTIANNQSDDSRGGISLINGSKAILNNSIVWGNEGYQIACDNDEHRDTVSVSYSDVQEGEEGIHQENGQALILWNDGNIDADPLFVDPDNGDFSLQADSPCIDAGDPDAEPDPDGSRADMGGALAYSRYAVVRGYVYDLLTDQPLAGVVVRIPQTPTRYAATDSTGFYLISQIRVEFDFSLTAALNGYADSTDGGFRLSENDTLDWDFRLLRPAFTPSQDEVSREVASGDSALVQLMLGNTGNYPLQWQAQRQMLDEPEPWEFMRSYHFSQIEGVAFVGENFIVAGHSADANYIYIVDLDGQLVDMFVQPGESHLGMRDLAWDGEVLWGSGEENIYGFTTEGGVIATFHGPYRVNQALAWDIDRELLWVCSITSNEITGYNRNGNQLAELPQPGFRIYGLAYWARDPDGYPLYIFHSPDGERQVVHKMNTDTGDTMFVRNLEPEEGGSPRGCEISGDYELFTQVFLSVANNGDDDRVDVWFLDADPTFLTFRPTEGVIDVGGAQEMAVVLSAVGLDTACYDADLRFRFPEVRSEATIPVLMRVMPNGISDFGFRILDFGLGEARPNPFNAVAVISYQLSVVSSVELRLYDISGRLVQTIDEGRQSAGEHRAIINGERLASGVYFLKLAAGNRIATRKIVCVK